MSPRGHSDRTEITRSAGRETVEIALHREGSSNTIVVADAIREALDGPPERPDLGLRAQMDDDLEVTFLTDQSIYISEAIGQVWSAAMIGGARRAAPKTTFLIKSILQLRSFASRKT